MSSRRAFGAAALLALLVGTSCPQQQADNTLIVTEQCPNPVTQKWLTDQAVCVCVDPALTIVDGQCRACPTCVELGFECGAICGGATSCGSCPPAWECVEGRCRECQSCEALGHECGQACGGELDCGGCGQGLKCGKNRCVPAEGGSCPDESTQHFATYLGRCQCDAADQKIVDGVCVGCDTCASRECGEICEGKVHCGYCGAGLRCEEGECVPGVSAFVCDDEICQVSGTIDRDVTFRSDRVWMLRGPVRVEASRAGTDAPERIALTIEPGTTVVAEPNTDAYLEIGYRTSIVAEGTVDDPIVFTSAHPVGARAPGDWGGLVLRGDYGHEGARGTLQYARIEFAGGPRTVPGKWNNGAPLALDPAGLVFFETRETSGALDVHHVQVHQSAGDGFHVVGGDMPLSHLVSTGAQDDHLDWSGRWVGSVSFFVGQSYAQGSDCGFEADGGYPYDEDTAIRVSNVTLIGPHEAGPSGTGILLREGATANIYNVVVEGWGASCFDLQGLDTMKQVFFGVNLTGAMSVDGSVMHCFVTFGHEDNAAQYHELEANLFLRRGEGNFADYPGLVAPYDPASPDWRPANDSPASLPGHADAEAPGYRGAVSGADWTSGWTTTVRY